MAGLLAEDFLRCKVDPRRGEKALSVEKSGAYGASDEACQSQRQKGQCHQDQYPFGASRNGHAVYSCLGPCFWSPISGFTIW